MSGNKSEVRRTPHALHGGRDIRDLPLYEKYEGWEKVNSGMAWESLEAMYKHTEEDFNVRVDVYLSPEGELRAYCHTCKSETCPHAYQILQGAMKSIILDILEKETGDFFHAIREMKNISRRKTKMILRKGGVNTRDLNRYISRMLRENKEEIEKHKDVYEGLSIYFPKGGI